MPCAACAAHQPCTAQRITSTHRQRSQPAAPVRPLRATSGRKTRTQCLVALQCYYVLVHGRASAHGGAARAGPEPAREGPDAEEQQQPDPEDAQDPEEHLGSGVAWSLQK